MKNVKISKRQWYQERLVPDNTQKTTAADGSLPYAAVCYFHRQAGHHLESGDVRGNMRVVLSDERRKTLDLIFTFFQNAFSFRSRKVVVSFPPPEKRIFSADIKGERLYGFEVMDFGYCSCR